MSRCFLAGRRARHGFSLPELLVAIGIISVLIALLIPTLTKAREQSRRTVCLSNLRSLGQAMFIYSNQFRDRLPNGNPKLEWVDYAGANQVMVYFADTIKAPAVFHCPSDRDPPPDQILTADQALPNSARISYEFYFLFFPPEQGPILSRLKGQAPLAWDVDAGSPAGTSTKVENHVAGGNVLFADGHGSWVPEGDWEAVSWPKPASQFYPTP